MPGVEPYLGKFAACGSQVDSDCPVLYRPRTFYKAIKELNFLEVDRVGGMARVYHFVPPRMCVRHCRRPGERTGTRIGGRKICPPRTAGRRRERLSLTGLSSAAPEPPGGVASRSAVPIQVGLAWIRRSSLCHGHHGRTALPPPNPVFPYVLDALADPGAATPSAAFPWLCATACTARQESAHVGLLMAARMCRWTGA